MNKNTVALSKAGVSIWLDSLSREILETGELKKMIEHDNVVGVTTNPSIFRKAIGSGSPLYRLDGFKTADTAVFHLTTDDVRRACDLFRPIYDRTDGRDGRVSIEVDPRMARDTARTIKMAELLYRTVDRPNVLIKIPATREGLPAITETIAKGISVNVTLIFSLRRYREVLKAYIDGLMRAHKNGHLIRNIHSVASFFISRIDTAVDPLLETNDSESAAQLHGRVGIISGQLAYLVWKNFFTDKNMKWRALRALGANRQRPLWASTGVKNPGYSPTLYVENLALAGTVNTMPPATLKAIEDARDFLVRRPRFIPNSSGELTAELARLAEFKINFSKITADLEAVGVSRFISDWTALLDDVSSRLPK